MKIQENIKLSEHTTFKIGGPAKFYIEVKNEDELLEAVNFAKKNKLAIFALGEGSDVLMNDDGFFGLVIKYKEHSLDFTFKSDEVIVTAGAGMIWDDLVKACVEKGLQGVECMSGIPGTVGAAPIQNIGAYGQEIKDTFDNLLALEIETDKFVSFDKTNSEFSYRDSYFKNPDHWQKYVITKVSLKLNKKNKPDIKYDSLKRYLDEKKIVNPNLLVARNAILEIRKGKFEDYHAVPNAGSFFKNPVINSEKLSDLKKIYSEIPCFDNGDGTYKCFAGWFIEQAGWKGKRVGNAQVSTKHALILLNPDRKATAMEVKELAKEIIGDVDKIFGIKLEPEVQYID